MAEKKFTVYRTQHGPIVRELNGKWVSIRMMQEPVKALMQSYSRTKAKDYKSYRQTMELKANSSNNTIFADADGDIAYFHGNYIPRRDTSFDWTKPVDGSNPATEWKGLLSIDETPHLLNPASGWLYNVEQLAVVGGGREQPEEGGLSRRMSRAAANRRAGCTRVRVLQDKKDFTLDSLMAAAYDSYLPWFEKPIPALLKAWDATPAQQSAEGETGRADRGAARVGSALGGRIRCRRRWRCSGARSARRVRRGGAQAAAWRRRTTIARSAPAEQLLQSLAAASDKLAADFGSWKTPWGDINRFQRLNGDIVQPFNDAGPSIPVGFTSAAWGSLASFGARAYPGTKKWYGTSGNSFVAVVEFGDDGAGARR